MLSIMFAVLVGQIWTPDHRVTDDAQDSYTADFSNGWQVAFSGDTVHIPFYDYRYGGVGDEELFYRRSVNRGEDWEPEFAISDPTIRWSFRATIAMSGARGLIAWVDFRDSGNFEVFYRLTTDAGTTWQPVDSATPRNTKPQNVSVALVGNTIHAAWHAFDGSINSYVLYRRSTDFGATWDSTFEMRPLNPSYRSCGNPSIAASGDTVYCVWYERRRPTTNGSYYYRVSTDAGATWSAEGRATTDAARLQGMSSASTLGTVSPSVAAYGSFLWVAWVDYRDGNYEVYFRRSTDRGQNWDAEQRLTNAADTACFASLTAHGENLYAVWSDRRDGNFEVYYKNSTDAGTTWSADVRLTDSPGASTRPSVAANDSAVHVAWCDYRDGNMEIYHKRGDLGPVAVAERALSGTGRQTLPTVARDVLFLPPASSHKPQAASWLLDATGRGVVPLHPGANDLRALPVGVYFVHLGAEPALSKVVLAR
jgi:hypothetical protein